MMNRWKTVFFAALIVGTVAIFAGACGSGTANSNSSDQQNADANENANETAETFTNEQLDNLLAPIALYPDPLLAQMLPAATFPDDVDVAAKYVKSNGNKGIDDQEWPVSVKSIAYYPEALYKMSDDPDWTTTLGQAYALQPTDVLDSIQRLRGKAKESGVLASTIEQEVVMDGDNIGIYPAQPQNIYVPNYDANEVYYEQKPSGGNKLVKSLITFGAGVAVGAWLNNAFNWNDDKVYYHGWQGNDGWYVRSRDYYRWDDDYYRNNYYVNDRYRDVYIDRQVIYRPVRYDRVRVYDRIYPGVSYRTVKIKRNRGIGEDMRRQNPGRPIEKGPPPGQLKKDRYGDRGGQPGPPLRDQKLGKGKADGPGRDLKKDSRKSGGPAGNKGGKPNTKQSQPSGKAKSNGGGGGKGKKN